MPIAPYPVSGVVRDENNSGNVNGATVIVRNVTKNEHMTQLTNSSGEFLIDLANFPTDYENSDKIQVTAYSGNGSGRMVLDRRHTVDTVTGSHHTGNLILHPAGDHFFSPLNNSNYESNVELVAYSVSNRDASNTREVHLYDRKNDKLIIVISVPAGQTVSTSLGSIVGKRFANGICVIYSNEGTTAITYPGDSAATNVCTVVASLVTR